MRGDEFWGGWSVLRRVECFEEGVLVRGDEFCGGLSVLRRVWRFGEGVLGWVMCSVLGRVFW